jgi:hypothetical protein
MSETAKRQDFVRGRWRESEQITAGYARALIEASRSAGKLDRPARVNKSLTHGQALDILERGIADYESGQALRPLVAKNILRTVR